MTNSAPASGSFQGFGDLSRPLIVAEIGNNHEGDFGLARELVQQAVAAGVDVVKFQTFRTEHYVSRSETARFERLTKFRLSFDQFEQLADLTHSLGKLFISTPLDIGSAEFLAPHVDFFKIASADNDFYPLMERVATAGKPVVVSSGLSDVAQMQRSVDFLRSHMSAPENRLAVLYCVSCYPAPPEQVSLAAIATMRGALRCPIGYSDHTLGIDAPLAAVALGALIVEKHFTIDKNYSEFRDHALSADPPEMRALVDRARLVHTLLGKPEKRMQPCEAEHATAIRRSIAAGADLPAGHIVRLQDLTWLRPGGGLPPGHENQLLGRKLRRGVSFGERLTPADVG